MKLDIAFKKTFSEHIGNWLKVVGFWTFIFTFWLEKGFFLGGNPIFLGHFQSSLEVSLPFCGLGIFAVFFGAFLDKTYRRLTQKQLLFLFSFLGFSALSSVFSFSPGASILFLIVWVTGFTSMSTGHLFVIEGKEKRMLLFASIFLGILLSIFVPELPISRMLLGIGSILGGIFALQEKPFRGRMWLLFFYTWGVIQSAHGGLLILFLVILLGLKFWLPLTKRKRAMREVLLPLFFLIGFGIWKFITGGILFVFHWGLPLSFFQKFQSLLFGAGEGQFLVALQNLSSEILLPSDFVLPTSSYLLTLSEKGFGGLFFLFLFLCVPSTFFKQKQIFIPLLFGLFLLITPVLTGTENGILFLSVFLFTFLEHRKKESQEEVSRI